MKIKCEIRRKRKINLNSIILCIIVLLLLVIDCFIFIDIKNDIIHSDNSYLELPKPVETVSPDVSEGLEDQNDISVAEQEQIDILTAEINYLKEENEKLQNKINELTNNDSYIQQDVVRTVVYESLSDTSAVWTSTDNNITNVTGITDYEIDLLIEKILTNRNLPLDNEISLCGNAIIQAEREYGISATAILSIITWETGFNSVYFVERNNCAGIKDSSGDYRYFNSKDESILYLGELLERYITDYGLSSWHDIGQKYCDKNWSIDVSSTTNIYNRYLEEIRNVSN